MRQWLEPQAASTSHRVLALSARASWVVCCMFGASVDLSLFVGREPVGEAGLDKDRSTDNPSLTKQC